jgi:hypothetical protein
MKTIFKLAVGAAIAGALVNMLMKQQQRSGNRMFGQGRQGSFDDAVDMGSEGASSTESVADTNTIGNEQNQRGSQPQDWRGAQNVLDS